MCRTPNVAWAWNLHTEKRDAKRPWSIIALRRKSYSENFRIHGKTSGSTCSHGWGPLYKMRAQKTSSWLYSTHQVRCWMPNFRWASCILEIKIHVLGFFNHISWISVCGNLFLREVPFMEAAGQRDITAWNEGSWKAEMLCRKHHICILSYIYSLNTQTSESNPRLLVSSRSFHFSLNLKVVHVCSICTEQHRSALPGSTALCWAVLGCALLQWAVAPAHRGVVWGTELWYCCPQ